MANLAFVNTPLANLLLLVGSRRGSQMIMMQLQRITTESLCSTWIMDPLSKLSGGNSNKKFVLFKTGGTTATVQHTVPSFC